jgi:hypothetical protein
MAGQSESGFLAPITTRIGGRRQLTVFCVVLIITEVCFILVDTGLAMYINPLNMFWIVFFDIASYGIFEAKASPFSAGMKPT